MAEFILSDWSAPPKTVPQAAKWLGIDRAKLYAAIEAGELPAYTPNGSTRRVIFEDDLVAWVKGK